MGSYAVSFKQVARACAKGPGKRHIGIEFCPRQPTPWIGRYLEKHIKSLRQLGGKAAGFHAVDLHLSAASLQGVEPTFVSPDAK
jgi:hypothetical protein